MIECTIHVNARQRGAALFVSLILLILLSLLGVTAMQVTILQERMAGNVREADLAFQRAEHGLRVVEADLVRFVSGRQSLLFGALGPPTWAAAGLAPRDCTMLERYPGLVGVPWEASPAALGEFQFHVVDLTDLRTIDGLERGSSCRPMDEGPSVPRGEYFLVTVQARGPAGTAASTLQTIFYWPE